MAGGRLLALGVPFCLGGRLVWDSRAGKRLPSAGELRFPTPVGAGPYSLKMLGRWQLGILGFPGTDISITCACHPGRDVGRREMVIEIRIMGTLYRNRGFRAPTLEKLCKCACSLGSLACNTIDGRSPQGSWST